MPVSIEQEDGNFMVKSNGKIIAEGLTNAQAWRLFDKLTNEPTSRQEDVFAWKFKKDANNE